MLRFVEKPPEADATRVGRRDGQMHHKLQPRVKRERHSQVGRCRRRRRAAGVCCVPFYSKESAQS